MRSLAILWVLLLTTTVFGAADGAMTTGITSAASCPIGTVWIASTQQCSSTGGSVQGASISVPGVGVGISGQAISSGGGIAVPGTGIGIGGSSGSLGVGVGGNAISMSGASGSAAAGNIANLVGLTQTAAGAAPSSTNAASVKSNTNNGFLQAVNDNAGSLSFGGSSAASVPSLSPSPASTIPIVSNVTSAPTTSTVTSIPVPATVSSLPTMPPASNVSVPSFTAPPTTTPPQSTSNSSVSTPNSTSSNASTVSTPVLPPTNGGVLMLITPAQTASLFGANVTASTTPIQPTATAPPTVHSNPTSVSSTSTITTPNASLTSTQSTAIPATTLPSNGFRPTTSNFQGIDYAGQANAYRRKVLGDIQKSLQSLGISAFITPDGSGLAFGPVYTPPPTPAFTYTTPPTFFFGPSGPTAMGGSAVSFGSPGGNAMAVGQSVTVTGGN